MWRRQLGVYLPFFGALLAEVLGVWCLTKVLLALVRSSDHAAGRKQRGNNHDALVNLPEAVLHLRMLQCSGC